MKYDNPFPGMNPYLEHPDIWPDFHFSLVAGLATALGPRLPHNYRIDLQRRVEVEEPSACGSSAAETVSVVAAPLDEAVAVRVRMPREVGVSWLRVETVPERELVTIVEVLSPTNKRPGEGRRRYIRKREAIVAGLVNLVEIDLLRRWEPMPLETPPPASDYRILVCRSLESPGAWLYPFMVRQRIPKFTLPLRSDDEAPPPEVDLGPIINTLHHTVRYGQITRYDAPPPEPAFAPEVAEWVEDGWLCTTSRLSLPARNAGRGVVMDDCILRQHKRRWDGYRKRRIDVLNSIMMRCDTALSRLPKRK